MVSRDQIEYYTSEGCAYFALALSKLTGLPIRMLVDEEEVYDDETGTPSIHHVYVFDPRTEEAIDIVGKRPEKDLQKEWKDKHYNPLTTHRTNEWELRNDYMGDDEKPLYGYSDEEIEEAEQIIRQSPDTYGISEKPVSESILDIIVESKADRMMAMLNKEFIPYYNIMYQDKALSLPRLVKNIIDIFVKDPQILWAMRWFRLVIYTDIIEFSRSGRYTSTVERLEPIRIKEIDVMLHKYGFSSSDVYDNMNITLEEWLGFTYSIGEFFEELEDVHLSNAPEVAVSLRSLDISSITPKNLLKFYESRLEDAYEKLKGVERFIDPEDESMEYTEDLKVYRNGWKWVLIHSETCEAEGKAMRHCGNDSEYRDVGDEIVSLREPISKQGKTYWKPHLTFVLSDDGSLKDMRGFANKKPDKKYHPYIMDILMWPAVKAVVGTEYESEGNFSIKDDLGVKDLKKLMNKRPDLIDFV